jgi:hypothetical protein
MKSLSILSLLLSSLLLISCGDTDFDVGTDGVNVETKKEDKSESYSYSYNYNGCETKKQTFSSKKALCNGLLNDSKNHYCAETTRHRHYKNSCEEYGTLEKRLEAVKAERRRYGTPEQVSTSILLEN